MLALKQILTCIFQVLRLWEPGATKSNEAISTDLILKLFCYCIVRLLVWLTI